MCACGQCTQSDCSRDLVGHIHACSLYLISCCCMLCSMPRDASYQQRTGCINSSCVTQQHAFVWCYSGSRTCVIHFFFVLLSLGVLAMF